VKNLRFLLLPALVLGLGACGTPDTTGDGNDITFIALQRDFQKYLDWQHFHLDPNPNAPAQDPHAIGSRELYLNRKPPSGSTSFPVGTIIVKHSDGNGDPTQVRTFAMVKRGGDYNQNGALNWEWFELLQDDTSKAWIISWRGIGPALGGEYGTTGDTCNTCHMAAKTNDFVQAEPLQLKTLSP